MHICFASSQAEQIDSTSFVSLSSLVYIAFRETESQAATACLALNGQLLLGKIMDAVSVSRVGLGGSTSTRHIDCPCHGVRLDVSPALTLYTSQSVIGMVSDRNHREF